MGDSSKKREERKHLRKRKKWAEICQKLEDDEGEMSSDIKLDLLLQRKNICIDIWWDLKKEEKILQADISGFQNEIKRLEKECGEESSCVSQLPPSDEESEEDEEESQSSNESQCASSDEESEGNEKESQCETCNARSYVEYLLTGLGGEWDSEEDYEAYQKAEQELEECEIRDADNADYDFPPSCAACFEHEVKRQQREEEASRYDSSE